MAYLAALFGKALPPVTMGSWFVVNIDHVYIVKIMYLVIVVGTGDMWISGRATPRPCLGFLYVLPGALATAISSIGTWASRLQVGGDIYGTTFDIFGTSPADKLDRNDVPNIRARHLWHHNL